MAAISRNAQVLKYLVHRVGPVGATKHLKLVYLADLVAREYLGQPVSNLDYIWYDEGPFDSAFYHAREELEAAGLGKEEPTDFPDGKTERTFRDSGGEVDFDLSEAETHILDEVAEGFGDYSLSQLLKVVYDTDPMDQASEGEPLPMEVVDRRGARETGLDLESVLEAHRAAAEGDFKTLEEFSGELRSEVTAAGAA